MRSGNDSPWGRFAFGAILLTVGTVFWLDRIGRLEARQWIPWWPLALIVMGLAHVPQRRWGAAAVWISIGVIFLMPVLGLAHFGPWRILGLWPLLISAGGVTLILQALRPSVPAANRFHAIAVMGGNVRAIGSQEFYGGEAVAVMGGVDIDLTAARLHQGEAVIDVLAFWGGVGIRVPAGWKVVNRIAEILGGYDDKTVAPTDPNAPRLVIRGSVIMGGIEVKNSVGRVS